MNTRHEFEIVQNGTALVVTCYAGQTELYRGAIQIIDHNDELDHAVDVTQDWSAAAPLEWAIADGCERHGISTTDRDRMLVEARNAAADWFLYRILPVAQTLRGSGPAFYGDRSPLDIAQDWTEAAGLDPDEAIGYIDAGFWEADTAQEFALRGITPAAAIEMAERIKPNRRWTTDSPIYAVCNGDASVDDFLE